MISNDHDHDKYITTSEFNKLTARNFASRLAKTNLAIKSDIANFVKKTDFDDNLNKKVTLNKTKHLLVENELKKLQTFNQAFLFIKVTLIMIEHNFTKYFNQFTKLFRHFLVFQTQPQNGNLRNC